MAKPKNLISKKLLDLQFAALEGLKKSLDDAGQAKFNPQSIEKINEWVFYAEKLNNYIQEVQNNTVPGGDPPPNPPGTH